MFELVVSLETGVELGHAKWHGLLGVLVDVLGSELLAPQTGLVRGAVIPAGILRVHRLEEGSNPSRLPGDLRKGRGGHDEALGQGHAELGPDNRDDAAEGDIGLTRLDGGLSVGDQVERLDEWDAVVDFSDKLGGADGLPPRPTGDAEELGAEPVLLGVRDAVEPEAGTLEECPHAA